MVLTLFIGFLATLALCFVIDGITRANNKKKDKEKRDALLKELNGEEAWGLFFYAVFKYLSNLLTNNGNDDKISP